MNMYKNDLENMSTVFEIYSPIYDKKNGKVYKHYEQTGEMFNASFKTYGGTEGVIDGKIQIEDTAAITTYFTPTITSDCRVCRLYDGVMFDVINEPENIDLRNQFLKFKVKRYKGKS